jgi:hypothetical protein
MTPIGLVIILIAAPVLVLTVLRINATLVFLSLCLGAVLVQFVGDEAANTIGILASDGSTNLELVSLGLLLLPAVFTAVVMIRTVKGNLKLAINLLPAISVGVLGLLLAEPLFSDGLRASIEATDAWLMITKLQTVVVGVSAIISLFFLWLQRPKHHKEEKHAK